MKLSRKQLKKIIGEAYQGNAVTSAKQGKPFKFKGHELQLSYHKGYGAADKYYVAFVNNPDAHIGEVIIGMSTADHELEKQLAKVLNIKESKSRQITKGTLKRIIREEYRRLVRQGLIK